MEYKIVTKDEFETIELAQNFESEKFPNMIICLDGELGSGKTMFTKGIANALGITETITSPTFTIIKEYDGELPLYHMDVYRLDGNTDGIGIEDYFNKGGVVVIEWASTIKDILPDERLDIKFKVAGENKRILILEPHGKNMKIYVRQFYDKSFIDTSVSKLILGLYKDEEVLFYENIDANNDLSSIALKDLNIALNNNGIKAKDIDNIYVSNGPGSFTGIRIGVTIAKTLAYTLNKKIYPISELKILASTSTDTNILVPLIDARRGYVYAGIYDQNLKALKEERYIKLEELVKELEGKNVTYISYDNLLNSIVPNPDIIKIINNSDQNVNPHLVKPNYLKKTEAEENYAKKCN